MGTQLKFGVFIGTQVEFEAFIATHFGWDTVREKQQSLSLSLSNTHTLTSNSVFSQEFWLGANSNHVILVEACVYTQRRLCSMAAASP